MRGSEAEEYLSPGHLFYNKLEAEEYGDVTCQTWISSQRSEPRLECSRPCLSAADFVSVQQTSSQCSRLRLSAADLRVPELLSSIVTVILSVRSYETMVL